MSDVRNSPYAGFLEEMCGQIMELQPDKISVCALMPDGTILNGYYGDCDQRDKALIADSIYKDSLMDFFRANARMLLEAAEEEPDEE